ADSESKLMSMLAPIGGETHNIIAHFDGHAHGAQRGIGTWYGIIEPNHQSIAGKPLQRSFVLVNELTKCAMILPQDADDFLRFRGFGKAGEAAQVAEHDCNLAAMA